MLLALLFLWLVFGADVPQDPSLKLYQVMERFRDFPQERVALKDQILSLESQAYSPISWAISSFILDVKHVSHTSVVTLTYEISVLESARYKLIFHRFTLNELRKLSSLDLPLRPTNSFMSTILDLVQFFLDVRDGALSEDGQRSMLSYEAALERLKEISVPHDESVEAEELRSLLKRFNFDIWWLRHLLNQWNRREGHKHFSEIIKILQKGPKGPGISPLMTRLKVQLKSYSEEALLAYYEDECCAARGFPTLHDKDLDTLLSNLNAISAYFDVQAILEMLSVAKADVRWNLCLRWLDALIPRVRYSPNLLKPSMYDTLVWLKIRHPEEDIAEREAQIKALDQPTVPIEEVISAPVMIRDLSYQSDSDMIVEEEYLVFGGMADDDGDRIVEDIPDFY